MRAGCGRGVLQFLAPHPARAFCLGCESARASGIASFRISLAALETVIPERRSDMERSYLWRGLLSIGKRPHRTDFGKGLI